MKVLLVIALVGCAAAAPAPQAQDYSAPAAVAHPEPAASPEPASYGSPSNVQSPNSLIYRLDSVEDDLEEAMLYNALSSNNAAQPGRTLYDANQQAGAFDATQQPNTYATQQYFHMDSVEDDDFSQYFNAHTSNQAVQPTLYDANQQAGAVDATQQPITTYAPIQQYYSVDSVEDDDSQHAYAYNAVQQRGAYYNADSIEDDDDNIAFYATTTQTNNNVAQQYSAQEPAQAQLFGQRRYTVRLGSAEFDDDFSSLRFKRSFQPLQYEPESTVDLSQINSQNFRSAGHQQQVTQLTASGEVETYELVGVAPSSAVNLAGIDAALHPTNTIPTEVPIYREIDNDDLYVTQAAMAALPTLYSAQTDSQQPLNVEAEPEMFGNKFVIVMD